MSDSIHPIKFFFCGCPQEPDYRNSKVTVVATAALGLIALGVTLSLMYHPAIGATCSVGLGLGVYAIWWRLRAEDGCCPLFWFSRVEPSLDEDRGVMPSSRPNDKIDPYARLDESAATMQGTGTTIRKEEVGVYGNENTQKTQLRELTYKLKPNEFVLIRRESQWGTLFVLSRSGDQCICSPFEGAILDGREQVESTTFQDRPKYVIKQLENHLHPGEYVRAGYHQYLYKWGGKCHSTHTPLKGCDEVTLETLYERMNPGTTTSRTNSQESVYFDADDGGG